MELYILFALLSAFSFSMASIVWKHVTKNLSPDYYMNTFYGLLIGGIASFAIWAVVPMSIPSRTMMLYIFVTAFLQFIGITIGNYNFLHCDVSVLGPLTQTKTLFAVILSFLFLGEVFSIQTYFWIAVMVIGGIITAFDENFSIKTFFTKVILLVIFTNLIWSVMDIIVKNILEEVDPWNTNAWKLLMMTPFSITLLPKLKNKKIWIGRDKLKFFFLSFGLADLLGAGLFLTAMEMGTVTMTNAFAMLRGPIIVLFTFLMSIFKPDLLDKRERKVYAVRMIGSLIMVLAAIKLAM